MKRIIGTILLVVIMAVCAFGCNQNEEMPAESEEIKQEEYSGFIPTIQNYNQKSIRRVNQFPDCPENYKYYDYKKASINFDKLAFSFAENDDAYNNPLKYKALCYPNDQKTWGPVGFFDNARLALPENNTTFLYKGMSFGLPTYVADRRTAYGAYEAITALPAILGASYAGIDKSSQKLGLREYNFVEMAKAYYDKNSNCVLNTVSSSEVGQSTWYALYPQVTLTRLYHIYNQDEELKQIVINGADAWLNALDKMRTPDGFNFEFMGFDIKSDTPVYGGWVDPPCGAMVFLFYSAYEITKNEKYISAIKEILDYLEYYGKNPNYEAMTDYLPFIVAKMNLEHGCEYNLSKYIDYLFENDSSVRQNWGMLTGKFGGYSVDGLVGDMSYAFAMNSFNLASLIAPMVKYDPRYSNAVGKYLLNLVNNAKWFFPKNMPLDNQTMNNYLEFDSEGCICYEGLKKSFNGRSPVACGDATSMFKSPCDLSLYSSGHVGYLGGMTTTTNVEKILRFDLNVTDSFKDDDYPAYLYYNPYDEDKKVMIECVEPSDLINGVNCEIMATNVVGKIKINIPAKSSVLLRVLPENSQFTIENDNVLANGIKIATIKPTINILSPGHSKYNMKSGDKYRLEYFAPTDDEVVNMKIYYDKKMVYDGEPVTEFDYSKDGLENTDYQFKVEITTREGRSDVASTFVVCR